MPLPRPPSADPLVALADQCVQCGLCLPACPTYRQDRIEAESPRGRIALARAWALDALQPTEAGDTHLDRCLACRSCEAVCPAGVRYGALLLDARARQRSRRRPTRRQRLIEWLTARPRGLAMLLGLYRHVAPALPERLRPLPAAPAPTPPISVGLTEPRTGWPPRAGDVVTTRSSTSPDPQSPPTPSAVALFVGCAARAYEPGTRDALQRLLAACGIAMTIPDGQTCCGTLHAHGGDASTAATLTRRNAAAFAAASTVVTLASGCHEAVTASAPVATVDALTLLARHADRLRFRPYAGRIALHLPCTQRNVVRSVDALHALLARVPGLETVVLDAGTGCCGAAGTAMLLDRDRAATFRAPLVARIEDARVEVVLSANLGCRLHLAGGTRVPVRHPVDFVAAQLDGTHAGAQ